MRLLSRRVVTIVMPMLLLIVARPRGWVYASHLRWWCWRPRSTRVSRWRWPAVPRLLVAGEVGFRGCDVLFGDKERVSEPDCCVGIHVVRLLLDACHEEAVLQSVRTRARAVVVMWTLSCCAAQAGARQRPEM